MEALKNQAEGGPPRLVGTVRRRSGRSSPEGVVPGARVTAQSESHRYQATTDAHGAYEITAMRPGRYFVEVSRDGFVPDLDYNKRSNGLIPNLLTRRLEPEPHELHGSVVVRENSCRTRNLAMWPHGRISGTVHDHLGNPAPGVTVQAFTVDDSGSRESSSFRTALSDSQGRYRIEPLPAGDYFIAVNGNNALNADPYPRHFHSTGPNTPPAKLQLSESAELPTVNLVLPPKRTRATLRVHLVSHDGSPFRGSHFVGVYSDAREYRWGKLVDSAPDGVIEIPVFLGDRYLVGQVTTRTEEARPSRLINRPIRHPSVAAQALTKAPSHPDTSPRPAPLP
ncbi:MAG: carboxypeptidase regulatory-like domain-containing protein [Bryobacterales bacterium]|nr:carboxypeptidase regulatory-like domain-containing protein [Bryobacterales bacterium]